ncbi:MAG: GMC family oxidoreductase N-terminal domain-containing protein [Lachnotalea sp.]
MKNSADVIVIGAGGGGAVVAKELCEKGLKVLLLEAGPWFGNIKWPRPNSKQGEVSSSDYEDLSINLLKESFTDLENDMNDSIVGKFRWGPANRNEGPWKRNIQNGGLIWQTAGVGGSTLHYFGNSPRAYASAIDDTWPISYNELLPYYEKVEQTLPVMEAPATAKENLFFYGAKKANWNPLSDNNVTEPGYRLQPNAILRGSYPIDIPGYDRKRDGPYGCTLRGNCVNGCHIGPSIETVAKRATFVSYIPPALRTGNIEIRPNAFVIKVLTKQGEEGLHTVGVIYRDTWTGERIEIRADVVVMSGGAIETPRLWLNSELPKNPWVGKGLVNHWFDNVTGIYEEEALMNAIGKDNINPFVGQNAAARFDYPGLGVIETYGMSPGLYASLAYSISDKGFAAFNSTNPDAPWNFEGAIVGEQLKECMRNYTKTLSLVIFTDDEVVQSNEVTLDYENKDENGYIPKIRYKPSENTGRKRDKLAVIAADILKKAGAKTIIRSNWPNNLFIHIQCTMRIGLVTDNDCEAKQVARLFIADNSVLYNSLGGPNPTLTTQALATRTAEKIKNKYFSERV